MSVHVFGNITKEELNLGYLPLEEQKGILNKVHTSYLRGENLFFVADNEKSLNKVLFQLGIPPYLAKPLFILSGFHMGMWGKVMQTLKREGLTFGDVQWVVGVSQELEETKDFYVTLGSNNRLVSVNGFGELDSFLAIADESIGISNGRCQNMVVLDREERKKKQDIQTLTTEKDLHINEIWKAMYDGKSVFFTSDKGADRIWELGSVLQSFQGNEVIIGCKDDLSILYNAGSLENLPLVALQRQDTVPLVELLDIVRVFRKKSVTVLEVSYTECRQTIEYLKRHEINGYVTVKDGTQEQLVEVLQEYGMYNCLCVHV